MTGDSVPPLRWGIVGTGNIAGTFSRDVQLLEDAQVVAVGSRSSQGAEKFGSQFEIARRHGSYEALVDDPGVDAVYVAAPQSEHLRTASLAIRAGKAVLCEKPFALNAAEAQELVDLARSSGVFLMEAMWTRWLPHIRRIGELLRSGVIGNVTTVIADHGQHVPPDRPHRLRRPDLGGGALLDLGVYPVSFASWVLGRPTGVLAMGGVEDGVDAQTSVLLRHAGGAPAVLNTSLQARGTNRAAVIGTAGRLEVDEVFFAPSTFRLVREGGGRPETWQEPRVGHGLRYQVQEVHRCMAAGLAESPDMPLEESVSIMATMDEVRRQIDLRFPVESR
jgi:predicted dehydrogenase